MHPQHTRLHRLKSNDGNYKFSRPNRKSTISTEQFLTKSRELLNLLYFGVLEIEEIDDNVTVEYHLKSENIKDDKILNVHVETIGSFQVLIDDKRNEITLFSPLSFTNIYIYNEIAQEWKSTIDGHNIIEIFARELNDHCRGYPKF